MKKAELIKEIESLETRLRALHNLSEGFMDRQRDMVDGYNKTINDLRSELEKREEVAEDWFKACMRYRKALRTLMKGKM